MAHSAFLPPLSSTNASLYAAQTNQRTKAFVNHTNTTFKRSTRPKNGGNGVIKALINVVFSCGRNDPTIVTAPSLDRQISFFMSNADDEDSIFNGADRSTTFSVASTPQLVTKKFAVKYFDQRDDDISCDTTVASEARESSSEDEDEDDESLRHMPSQHYGIFLAPSSSSIPVPEEYPINSSRDLHLG